MLLCTIVTHCGFICCATHRHTHLCIAQTNNSAERKNGEEKNIKDRFIHSVNKWRHNPNNNIVLSAPNANNNKKKNITRNEEWNRKRTPPENETKRKHVFRNGEIVAIKLYFIFLCKLYCAIKVPFFWLLLLLLLYSTWEIKFTTCECFVFLCTPWIALFWVCACVCTCPSVHVPW